MKKPLKCKKGFFPAAAEAPVVFEARQWFARQSNDVCNEAGDDRLESHNAWHDLGQSSRCLQRPSAHRVCRCRRPNHLPRSFHYQRFPQAANVCKAVCFCANRREMAIIFRKAFYSAAGLLWRCCSALRRSSCISQQMCWMRLATTLLERATASW